MQCACYWKRTLYQIENDIDVTRYKADHDLEILCLMSLLISTCDNQTNYIDDSNKIECFMKPSGIAVIE